MQQYFKIIALSEKIQTQKNTHSVMNEKKLGRAGLMDFQAL
jgi:hypothetical protein